MTSDIKDEQLRQEVRQQWEIFQAQRRMSEQVHKWWNRPSVDVPQIFMVGGPTLG
jgi:hypothetical protein